MILITDEQERPCVSQAMGARLGLMVPLDANDPVGLPHGHVGDGQPGPAGGAATGDGPDDQHRYNLHSEKLASFVVHAFRLEEPKGKHQAGPSSSPILFENYAGSA